MKHLHALQGVKKMRASGKLAAQVLEFAGTIIRPGITTDEIDQAVIRSLSLQSVLLVFL